MYIAKGVSDFFLFYFGNVSIPKSISILMYCNCTWIYFTFLIKTLFSFSENLTVGTICLNDVQCTGTKFSSVCFEGQCTCQSGYILNDNKCYPGK